MKQSKLQQLKDTFYWLDEKPVLDIYGQFMQGLTWEEIQNYLMARANKLNIKKEYQKFIEIAGCNTGALAICKVCKTTQCLMYRHDVLRFADKLFEGKETYFD